MPPPSQASDQLQARQGLFVRSAADRYRTVCTVCTAEYCSRVSCSGARHLHRRMHAGENASGCQRKCRATTRRQQPLDRIDWALVPICPCSVPPGRYDGHSPAAGLHWSQRYHANEPTTMQTAMPPATKGKQADLSKSSQAEQHLLLLHNKRLLKGPRTQHNARRRTQRSSTQPLVSGTQQPRTLTPSTQRPLPRSNVTRRLPSRPHAASSEACCEK
jgi:hypothetical protein